MTNQIFRIGMVPFLLFAYAGTEAQWTYKVPMPFVPDLTFSVCRTSGGPDERLWQELASVPAAARQALPPPDALSAAGDNLYALYRKGLITRHITRNGRVLPMVPLEKVPASVVENYNGAGVIRIRHSDGTVIPIPVQNVRYSLEQDAVGGAPVAIMWAPVIGPLKDPGFSNNGYYVVGGTDDNPFYYSTGWAMAVFALEHMHKANPHSLKYARRILLYYLQSEMWNDNGYIVRRPGFFNHLRNPTGAPIAQGASVEEVLGFMLGLMYYVKAEDPNHPLYREAVRLRDDVLRAISRKTRAENYEHAFMNSAKDPSYWLKHFETALYAPREYYPGKGDVSKALYRTTVLGQSAGVAEFENYMMSIASMFLVLDSDALTQAKKTEYAEFFMVAIRLMMESEGPALRGNLLLALAAKLANKHINKGGDPDAESSFLLKLWGTDIDSYRQLVAQLRLPNLAPTGMVWQHNLPLMSRPLDAAVWKDHNPYKRIGGFFIWRFEQSNYYWTRGDYYWDQQFPGWLANSSDWPWVDLGPSVNEAEYWSGRSKRYPSGGYVRKELAIARQSDDNQVEGAGLDLLFARIFLTHLQPNRFPAPNMSSQPEFPVLPLVAAEPFHHQSLHHAYRFQSKGASCGAFEIGGDRDDALRVLGLSASGQAGKEFVLAYANPDNRLILKHGMISDGTDPSLPEGLYLDSLGVGVGRFDRVALAETTDDAGRRIVVVADRAEKDRTTACDLHWLRVSMYRVPQMKFGGNPNLQRLASWEMSDPDCDAVKELDVVMIERKRAAVVFRSKRDRLKVRVVELGFSPASVVPATEQQLEPVTLGPVVASAAPGGVLLTAISTDSDPRGYQLLSYKWNGSSFDLVERDSINLLKGKGLFDLETIDPTGFPYVVAVGHDGRSLVLQSWRVSPGGLLSGDDGFRMSNDDLLLAPETSWDRASIKATHFDDKPGFVIAGKGVALNVVTGAGEVNSTTKGMKILSGRIVSGVPSVTSSAMIGEGDTSAVGMVDVTGTLQSGGVEGVLSFHRTQSYCNILGLSCKYYVNATYWRYRDPFKDQRWRAPGPSFTPADNLDYQYLPDRVRVPDHLPPNLLTPD